MNGKVTLEQRLIRLASSGVAGPAGQVLRAPGPDALLSRLLTEIDETVLPRRVHLDGAGGGPLTFAAANGRLIRIEAAALSGSHDDLLNQSFDPGDTGVAERLKALFVALTAGGDTVTIRRETTGDGFDPGHAGLSAETLAEVWGVPLRPSGGTGGVGGAIDSFLGAVHETAAAWMLTGIETNESESAGDEERVDELLAFAEARRETGESVRHAAETMGEPWNLLALHRAAGAEDVTVILSVEGILLYLAAPRTKLGTITDTWRRAVADG